MKLLWVFILFGAWSFVALADDPPIPRPSNVLVIDGETYENVKYINATAAKITFRHRRGIAVLPIEKFPPEIQRRFGYNPEKAKEERAAEESSLREQARRAAIAAAQAKAQKQLDEDAQRKRDAERSNLNRAKDEARRMEELRQRNADRRARWRAINPHVLVNPDLKLHKDRKFNSINSAIHGGNLRLVESLLRQDPTYITARGDDGETPLHVAASLGFNTICAALLDAKADVNARCNKGKTPVRWARDAKKDSTAEFLRQRGGKEF